MKSYSAILPAPFAALGVVTAQNHLTAIDFLPVATPAQAPQDELTCEVCRQLELYLRDPHHCFELPLALSGTAFQRRVWESIARIPAGASLSYAALARQLGSGARAVANACGANALPVVIPCHRVVASNGIGGFLRGCDTASLDIKQWLLNHERSQPSPAG